MSDHEGEAVISGYESEEWYTPLQSVPTLFLEFASLSDDPQVVASFAETYGNLDRGGLAVARGDFWAMGWPVGLWRAHRRLLAFAVDVWEALQAGRAERLMDSKLFVEELRGQEAEGVFDDDGRVVAAKVWAPIGESAHDVRQWRGGCFGEPQSLHLRKRKETIAYLEHPNLSPTAIARSALSQFVTTQCTEVSIAMVTTHSPYNPLRLTFRPDTLVDAMWLQLALAIDGWREYRTCPVCGRWWDATAARSDKITCSDACRKSRQRSRAKGGGD